MTEIKISNRNSDGKVKGNIGIYGFEAKITEAASDYGINGGRITELTVWDKITYKALGGDAGACAACYDMGWEMQPKGITANNIIDAVVDYLENMPLFA